MENDREEVRETEREREREREWDFSLFLPQTVEWARGNVCEKCGIPFFWNVKEMWKSKTLGVRQVRQT